MKKKWVVIFILSFVSLSCQKHEEEKAHEIKVYDIAEEIQAPAALFKDMYEKTSEVPGDIDTSRGFQLMSVNVIMHEKTKGVLKKSPLKIILPRGGGAIDFAKYLDDQKGTFYVSFEWPDLIEDGSNPQIWFVSEGRKRNIDNETWGTGCHSFFRLTKSLLPVLKKDGIKLNTTRNFHLSVMNGNFIFSAKKHRIMLLSQVHFFDSRFPEYSCPSRAKAGGE